MSAQSSASSSRASSPSPSPKAMEAMLSAPKPPAKPMGAIAMLNQKVVALEKVNKELVAQLEAANKEIAALKAATTAPTTKAGKPADGSVMRVIGLNNKETKCWYVEDAAKYGHKFVAGEPIMGVDVSQKMNSKDFLKVGEYLFEYVDKRTLKGHDGKVYPHQGGRVNFVDGDGKLVRMKIMYGMTNFPTWRIAPVAK